MSNQVYGYITDKIMKELERGCVPWHKPWKSPDGVRVPMNYAPAKAQRPRMLSSCTPSSPYLYLLLAVDYPQKEAR